VNKKEFLALIAETIQTDAELNEGTVLADIEEWDSLAALTILGLYKRTLEISLTTNDIASCQTVADLIAKTQGKID